MKSQGKRINILFYGLPRILRMLVMSNLNLDAETTDLTQKKL